MARTSRRPRHIIDQNGAPEPVTDENTVWIGKQPGEAEAKPAKSKND